MGLDMYAYTAPVELVGDCQVDLNDKLFKDGHTIDGVDTDFAYWRKFNHLHGWMERLYREKGGEGVDFNCNTLRLTQEDIDRLERDMNLTRTGEANKLPATAGFFFGGDDIYPEDLDELEGFIARSREAINNGKAVIYDSWW